MFNSTTLFLTLSTLPHPMSIKLGDGKIITSTYGGPTRLTKDLTVYALYVPAFKVCLLSVSCLDLSGFHAVFSNKICTIYQNNKTTDILTGYLENGIYIHRINSQYTASSKALTAITSTPSTPELVNLWHRRLGHINHDYVKILFPNEKQSTDPCNICILSKQKRAAHRKTPAERAIRPFQLIHSDSCTITTPSLSGSRYYLIFIDDLTRWTFVFFLKQKNAITCTQAFNEMIAYINTQYSGSYKIQRFRCDNGSGEYDNQLFRETLTTNGISFEPSPPYTQNMNGVAERMIQTLNTRARSMMIDANIPIAFWAEMINTAVYLQHRSPTTTLEGRTPYEALHNATPALHHLRRIGCVAYHRIPDEKFPNKTILKFGPRSIRCMLIGYTESTKIWKLWDIEKQRAIRSTDVRFIEQENACISTSTAGITARSREEASCIGTSTAGITARGREEASSGITARSREEASCTSTAGITARMTKEQTASAFNSHVIEQLDMANLPTDPATHQEAMSSLYQKQWIQSMREELSSLHENETWENLPESASPTHTIGSKWVYKTKPNPDGTVRFKSRLVVKGYKQIKGIDYNETYAPVSRLATLRIILAFASEKNWECHQMDVVTAFLNPKIDQENVLMELPELDYLGDLSKFNLKKSSSIVRLKKALYGLKQAPRLWSIEINSYLLSLGFCQSSVEPSLYIADSAILLLYVDDMLIVFEDISVAEEIKQRLQKKYKMTDLGPVKRFLGMTIERTKNGYNLHQESYIKSLLSKYGMTDSYDACTPIETHAKLDIKSGDIDALVDQKAYLAIVGSLMYAALGTRPDISYTVGLLSRFNSDPRTRHLTAAKRVLRYLKRTKDLKLEYKQTGKKLQGFVDSDWANEKDRKSIGGYTFTFGGAAVSWASKKQTIVAQSTEEAEYTAFTEGSREALWIRQLLLDIEDTGTLAESTGTTTIYADNQAALKHVRTGGITARNKHFDIRLQHSRDNQAKGTITFEYIKSDDNTADIFTKALPLPAHQRHLEGLGLTRGISE